VKTVHAGKYFRAWCIFRLLSSQCCQHVSAFLPSSECRTSFVTKSLSIALCPTTICHRRAQESEFTSGRNGEYKVQENGNMIRFSIDTTGLTRTVQTTGTITKIFWSDSDEVRTLTSSSYSIPPGFVYADSIIRYGSIPRTYDMDEGILCAEQTSGLFGVSSKMIPCGKFRARMINEE